MKGDEFIINYRNDVASFIKFENDKICELDEYWSEDGIVPQWRLDKCIGKAIK